MQMHVRAWRATIDVRHVLTEHPAAPATLTHATGSLTRMHQLIVNALANTTMMGQTQRVCPAISGA